MKKTIECKLGRTQVRECINALNEGKIKVSAYHISSVEECYGKFVDDSNFELFFKQAFFIKIKGKFIDGSDKLQVEILYTYWKYIWFVVFNLVAILAVAVGLWGHKYSCSLVFCVVMILGNVLSVFVGRIIIKSYYDLLYSLLCNSNFMCK